MMPLVLLAGFLGAGKTRFLTDVIPLLHAQGVRVRIVLNDFENALIDASRLAELDALVTPLDGACVCCSSLRELLDTLHAVPPDPGSVLIIEANGATEAQELLGHLTQDRKLAHFTLPLQLTVIDAGRWQKRWWHNALERSQAETATHLLLNWTHGLRSARLAAVRESLVRIAPRALVTTPQLFSDSMVAMVTASRAIPERPALVPVQGDQVTRQTANANANANAHANAHDHPFASAQIPLPQHVDREQFLAFVRALPAEVVRAKGFVRFTDQPSSMFVWHRMADRARVELNRSVPHAGAQPTALFIGVQLPLDTLRSGIALLA
ncbi:MAG: GTP-binding protein [Gemmatimonadota bacterium]